MIETYSKTSKTHIYWIDLVGYHLNTMEKENMETWFAEQINILTEQESNEGMFLKTISPLFNKWLVVFQPK